MDTLFLLLFTRNTLEVFSLRKTPVLFMNLALALGHRGQLLAATLVRLSVDIVFYLGPAKPVHILLQGQSGEGEL